MNKIHLRIIVEPLLWDLIPQVEKVMNWGGNQEKTEKAKVTHFSVRFLCFDFLFWRDF